MSIAELEVLEAPAIAALAEKVQWLMDRAEIEDVLARYSRGIDRADLEVLKSVYHEGATDEHGIFSGTGAAFAEWVVGLIQENYVSVHHDFTTTSMDIQGAEAEVETYFHCVNKTRDNGLVFCGGRCADRFEKRRGRWGIVHRQVIMDWTQQVDDVTLPEMDRQFLAGKYADQDATYQLLRRLRQGGFHPGRPSS
jgi:hypothetical protein